MGENWNIDTRTFSQNIDFPFHEIPTLWHFAPLEICLDFPVNFLQYWKMQQNLSYDKNLGYWYPYFFQVIRLSAPSNFHPMVYYKPWMVHVFPHEFLVALLNFREMPLSYEKYLEYWYPYFPQIIGYFSSVKLPSHGMLKRELHTFFRLCLFPHITPTERTWKYSVQAPSSTIWNK